MGKIIGIDLGTTNSCVSVFEGNKPVVITNKGKRTTPSIVAFLEKGGCKIGESAKRQAVTNPRNTIFSIKRFIGRNFNEIHQKELNQVQYRIVNKDGYPYVEINNQYFSPQEISALILRELKEAAEAYLGQEVTEAVISVPAYFNDSQRLATKEAGQIAGLEVKRIISEPSAAALAYGIDKANKDMKIAVFDLGGGTFDISILEFGGGVFEVLSTNGDTHLGGDDFDQVIIDWLVQEFKNDEGADLTQDPMALQRLKEAAEKAKIELSSTTTTEINLPYIMPVGGVPKHLVKTLTRAKFEALAHNLIQACLEPCKKAMSDAGLSNADIDEVILVGGSTRIPAVQKLVEDYFGKDPSRRVTPDEVVAVGASIQGAILYHEEGVGDIVLLDVIPLSIGIETAGGIMTKMIDANTSIPIRKIETFSTANDNQTEVTIHILQGEHQMAAQNKSIGQFNLTGITPAPRGIPQIEVIYFIDADGILKVSAKDKTTGKEQAIRIESSGSLTPEEIKGMKNRLHNIMVGSMTGNESNALKNKGTNTYYRAESKPYTQQSRANMKYDIFISYARKDFDEVNRFVEMLKERIPSLTCWFDITGIESGDEFQDKIISAIDNSSYILFALSDHSIQSRWTKDEVMYAKNSGKKIIPLLLKGAYLKGWFLFNFGQIDCIDTTNSLQVKKLIRDLSNWTKSR